MSDDCEHRRTVDLDRLMSISDASQQGLSRLVHKAQAGPVWLTRNGRVVAVVHAVGTKSAEE